MEIQWLPCPQNPRKLLITLEQELWKEVDKRLFTPFLCFLKKAMSQKELEEIFEQIEKKAALQEAFRILAVRSCFSLEIRKKLEKKGLSSSSIQEAIEKCKEVGALNDEEQASRYVEKEKRKGRGPHLIALKLQAKLGKKEVALPNLEEQIPIIEKLLSTRYKAWQLSLQEKQKAFMALKRRGFSTESILAAMNDKSGLWQ